MPTEDACALIYNINVSLNQYQQMRLYMLPHNIHLPTGNVINSYKNSLMIPCNVESTKTSCLYKDLVADTISSLLICNMSDLPSAGTHLHVTSKFGVDGSGSHQKRHQLVENDLAQEVSEVETSYIGAFWCTLTISVGGNLFWTI